MRVQLRARNLIISGERKLNQNTWSRFRVEFPVSGYCDLNKISAKFEGNILFVRQPKLITPAPKQEEPKPTTPKQEEPKPEEPKTAVVATPQKPKVESNTSADHPTGVEEEEEEKVQRKSTEEDVSENIVSKKERDEWDKKNHVVYGEIDKNVLQKYKQAAGAFGMKLKTSCNVVNTIVVVVIGLVVGLYVSNSLKSSWAKASLEK